MNLKKSKLNLVGINNPTCKFLIIGIFVILLPSEFTWNTIDLKGYIGYVAFATLQEENKDYEIDSLFVALLTNGDASIDYNMVIKNNRPSTNVTLFGETVRNLTLADYNETNIGYVPTGVPNKITVFSQNSSNIHVTYTTSDLVDKNNRNWTFSFSFPDRFLLKMPSRAHIINMEPPAFLTPTDDQNLWGFGPGNVQVNYVIGPLGTREEAQASIRSVEERIEESRSNYEGIVIDNATGLLENARSNFKQGKYLETVTDSTNALTLLQTTGENFIMAKDAISQAESDIQDKRNNGYDTSRANKTLSTARNLFVSGNYKNAENVAKQATSQAQPKSSSLSGIDINIATGILGALVAIILIIFYAIRKRKGSVQRTIIKEPSDQSSSDNRDSIDNPKDDKASNVSNNTNTSRITVHNVSPIQFPVDSPRNGVEIKDYLEKVVQEVGNVRKNQEQQERSPTSLSPSRNSIDKELLVKAVSQMKIERPHLRNEDKQLLDFLCEKEGSAFESEIRNKFVLPRTSLWRLIKRLEREELVEVRKIGGQNLIKLRIINREGELD